MNRNLILSILIHAASIIIILKGESKKKKKKLLEVWSHRITSGVYLKCDFLASAPETLNQKVSVEPGMLPF